MNQALKLNLFIVFLEVAVVVGPLLLIRQAEAVGAANPFTNTTIFIAVAAVVAFVGQQIVKYSVERELGANRVLDLVVRGKGARAEEKNEVEHRYIVSETYPLYDSSLDDLLKGEQAQIYATVREYWDRVTSREREGNTHIELVNTDEGWKLFLMPAPFEVTFSFSERFIEGGLWGKKMLASSGSALSLGEMSQQVEFDTRKIENCEVLIIVDSNYLAAALEARILLDPDLNIDEIAQAIQRHVQFQNVQLAMDLTAATEENKVLWEKYLAQDYDVDRRAAKKARLMTVKYLEGEEDAIPKESRVSLSSLKWWHWLLVILLIVGGVLLLRMLLVPAPAGG